VEGRALFLDASAQGDGWGQSLTFGEPLALRRAEALAQVPGVIRWAEAEALAGRWVVLAVAYEAAPAFDAALRTHPPHEGVPLAWAASYAAPQPTTKMFDSATGAGAYAATPWQPLVDRPAYDAGLARLRQLIAEGETYQANYTLPFTCDFRGDDQAWFADLARRQGAGFCAWLDLGRHRVLSLSPELFFSVRQGEVLARPMKGTALRGATPLEDAARRAALASSPKDRAENVMIVDLLRNDLGRVAIPGGVEVPELFRVEAYPTVFQLTSDVRAQLRPDVGLWELLAALFPCGSITGAPKVATMRLLREVEPHPRGLYCGAIGVLEPGARRMRFSVPIRTILLEVASGRACFGVGGGVTWDSTAQGEYAECQAKMRFLEEPDSSLLESLLLQNGRYPFLRGHLERLGRSAVALGYALDLATVREALLALALDRPEGRFKVRLLVDRAGQVHAEAAPISRNREVLPLGLCRALPVHSQDASLRHKTTRRARYEAALAACPGCFDALLLNERGEVTEATRANLVLLLDAELVTPPLESGLLPGVFRAMLLAHGRLRERVLTPQDVLRAQRVWLVNSVRGWMPCAAPAGDV
jgi:para-aminobenzoate synthetase/4-amino-4-deoxychorismate lyase